MSGGRVGVCLVVLFVSGCCLLCWLLLVVVRLFVV